MPFKKIKSRFNSLPLVLCGPIVRKTDEIGVSIWIACKEKVDQLQLKVYETKGGKIGKRVIKQGTASTRQFGRHLHIALITADHPIVAVFQSGVIYAYDIDFGTKGQSLKAKGVIGFGNDPIKSISYSPFELPTFCLPVEQFDNLRIVQGSCRKPHGGKIDAMQGLNQMLSQSANDIRKRPQMLFLTGDQIYADDVAAPLLHLLIDAQEHLLGWKEQPTLPEPFSSLKFDPGYRQDIVAKDRGRNNKVGENNMTSQSASSHLVFLGEFFMMYLFVWSDVLWPEPVIDDFKRYHESALQMQKIQEKLKALGESIADPNYKFLLAKELVSGAKRDSLNWELNFEKNYQKETKKILKFRRSLPMVRKAMANISTYMIFDDHEVTDDWFLNRIWCEKILKGKLSRRIILNGLTAYAVFQDWGNSPSDYQKGNNQRGNKHQVLQQMEQLGSHPHQLQSQVWKSLDPILLSKLQNGRLISKLRWDYQLSFKNFAVTVLDTRTKRRFTSSKGDAELISSVDTEMDRQLPDWKKWKKDLLLVVSAAPFFGNYVMEGHQKAVRNKWSIRRVFKKATAGMFDEDQEAWAFNNEAYYKFMGKLVPFSKVLLLSGDVHYSLSSSLRIKNSSSSAAIVNLTSSSLKNSTSKTQTVGGRKLHGAILLQPNFLHKMVFSSVYKYSGLIYQVKTELHRDHKKKNGQLLINNMIVGEDNISIIYFKGDKKATKIFHEFWFDWSGKGKFGPHTKHEIQI